MSKRTGATPTNATDEANDFARLVLFPSLMDDFPLEDNGAEHAALRTTIRNRNNKAKRKTYLFPTDERVRTLRKAFSIGSLADWDDEDDDDAPWEEARLRSLPYDMFVQRCRVAQVGISNSRFRLSVAAKTAANPSLDYRGSATTEDRFRLLRLTERLYHFYLLLNNPFVRVQYDEARGYGVFVRVDVIRGTAVAALACREIGNLLEGITKAQSMRTVEGRKDHGSLVVRNELAIVPDSSKGGSSKDGPQVREVVRTRAGNLNGTISLINHACSRDATIRHYGANVFERDWACGFVEPLVDLRAGDELTTCYHPDEQYFGYACAKCTARGDAPAANAGPAAPAPARRAYNKKPWGVLEPRESLRRAAKPESGSSGPSSESPASNTADLDEPPSSSDDEEAYEDDGEVPAVEPEPEEPEGEPDVRVALGASETSADLVREYGSPNETLAFMAYMSEPGVRPGDRDRVGAYVRRELATLADPTRTRAPSLNLNVVVTLPPVEDEPAEQEDAQPGSNQSSQPELEPGSPNPFFAPVDFDRFDSV